MQGYVTSEPFAVEKAGVKPKIFLLADQGFNTYSTLIETRRETVEKRPDLVQRFVDASAIGWYNYLYGDNKAANELIRKHNPEMSQELIDYSIAKMKEYGIVDSGDTLKLGIGAMTDARMASFFDKMVKAGVVKPSVDFRKSYTLQFVNKGVGLELRPKIGAVHPTAQYFTTTPQHRHHGHHLDQAAVQPERQHRRDDRERGRLQVERERIEREPAQRAGVHFGRPAPNSTCSANQTVRLRITPTTAAVIAASAPERWRLRAQCSTNGAPAKIHSIEGVNVTHVVIAAPRMPAVTGGERRRRRGTPRGSRRTASPG